MCTFILMYINLLRYHLGFDKGIVHHVLREDTPRFAQTDHRKTLNRGFPVRLYIDKIVNLIVYLQIKLI